MDKRIESQMDIEHLSAIRANIRTFLKRSCDTYKIERGRMLDIAPQDHEGARPFFPGKVQIETLDIDPSAQCTYTADLCNRNESMPEATFDYIVCTEVLEHTLRPWDAVKEIRRLLKPAGLLFLTTPFNFRIHGPLPDCWRFTEHGLRALLADYEILEIRALETANRALMPIQYAVVAKKPVERARLA